MARLGDGVTTLDEFGILRVGDAWVALSPVQERLMGALLERVDAPVARSTLIERAWPGGEPARALDIHMAKLRARLSALPLAIVTLRGRGFLLTTARADRRTAS